MNEGALPELPEGWVWTRLGELIEPSNEKADPLKIRKMPYIGLEHIEKDTGKLLSYGDSNEVKSTKTRFHSGDLLYGKLRPYLNKVLVVDFDGICSTDILVFSKNSYISNKYIAHRFLCSDFVRYANQNVSGVQHPRVNFYTLSQFSIPLPPLPEQRAIVSKIEQLFSDLDNGIKNFKKAQAQLKLYRQAVLKKAFEGELTKKWREEQSGLPSANILMEQIERTHNKKRNTLKSITEEEKKILSELPETWTWGRLGNLVNQIVVGYVGPITKSLTDDENNGVRLLSTTHIGEKKFLNNKEIRFVTKQFSEKNKKSEVKSGDILVARHGDSGKCCIIPENIQIAQVSNVVVIRPNNKAVLNKFLIYSFGFLKQELQKKKVGGVQQVVNTKTMEAFPFPFCSLQEQHQIIHEIETRLSICDKMEATIAESLQKAESLRQSILKKAFEGKLLNEKELEKARNAPDWEPAEKLLERIRKEKAQTGEKKRKR